MSSSDKKAADRAATAAAMRAAQARRESQRRLLTIGGVALVMILIVGGAIVFSIVKNNHDQTQREEAVSQLGTSKYGLVIGPDSAPHHVVIYEDFLCPICGYLESHSRDQLAKLAAEGKVQVDYRPFDLLGGGKADSYSVRSAGAFSVVLQHDGVAVAKKFHDILYANQPSESGPFPSDEQLAAYARQAGATSTQVKQAILSHAGEAWVTGATTEASDAGVGATPSVFLDGKQLDPTSYVDQVTRDLLAAVS
ncbi:DsbA family protein [Nocardioides maradonensis]